MYAKFQCGASVFSHHSLSLLVNETTLVEGSEFINYLPCGEARLHKLTDIKLSLIHSQIPSWAFKYRYLAVVNGLTYPIHAVGEEVIIQGAGLAKAYQKHAQIDFIHFPTNLELVHPILNTEVVADPIDNLFTVNLPSAGSYLLFIAGLWIRPSQIVVTGTEAEISLTTEQLTIISQVGAAKITPAPVTLQDLINLPSTFLVKLPNLSIASAPVRILDSPIASAPLLSNSLAVSKHGHVLPYIPMRGGQVRLRYCHELPTEWATITITF